MKIALVAGHRDGAIDQVMRPLAAGLREQGVEADLFSCYAEGDKTFRDYDLVHFGYFQYGGFYEGYLSQPTTANIWHIPNGKAEEYAYRCHNLGFDRLIVDKGDVTTIQALGQQGITNVTPIPILFDTTKFKPLPPPEGAFSVGVFCNNYPHKRWETIIEACHLADVACHAVVTQHDRKSYDIDPIEDVYANCHVLAHATFVDTNSLPCREALLCGRPVITTHNGGIHQVVKDGVNGRYFDGSVGDLKKAILEVKANYDHYRAQALATQMPTTDSIVLAYKHVFERVLDELQGD